MKQIAFILIVLFMGCKSETKTENGIDPSVIDLWDSYTASNPEFKNNVLPDASYFHNNRKDANRLAQLILEGKKQAGSNLYFFYEQAKADLPKIGTMNIVTDFDGKAIAIIETKQIDTIPFNKISKNYAAMDMGTTNEPLEKWKKAHWAFFAPAIIENGGQPSEDMLIVCEQFRTIWPKK
jgi:uncharacterized protein YhfF